RQAGSSSPASTRATAAAIGPRSPQLRQTTSRPGPWPSQTSAGGGPGAPGGAVVVVGEAPGRPPGRGEGCAGEVGRVGPRLQLVQLAPQPPGQPPGVGVAHVAAEPQLAGGAAGPDPAGGAGVG